VTSTEQIFKKRALSTEARLRTPEVAVYFKRACLVFLQSIFSQRQEGDFKYDEDESRTDIFIGDQKSVNLKASALKPSIVTVRGPISGMDMGTGNSGIESRDMKTGNRMYNGLSMGSVGLSCYSREGTEAERLAQLVFNAFRYFKPYFGEVGLFQVRSLNLGAEATIEQGVEDELSMVPVYVSLQAEERWSLSSNDGIKLRDILIDVKGKI
jgi:hypothetical protein